MDNFRAFGRNTDELVNQAARRQMELKDPQLRDNLAAARAVLKKNSMMLLTASKVRQAQSAESDNGNNHLLCRAKAKNYDVGSGTDRT